MNAALGKLNSILYYTMFALAQQVQHFHF